MSALTIWPEVVCGVCAFWPKNIWVGLLHIRAAQTFLGKCLKLHGGPWAKRLVHTNFYLTWASFDHVSRAAKIWVFRPIITESAIFRSPRDVVKWCPNLIKIGMHSHFGPRTPVEFEAFFQKNWAGLHIPTAILENALLKVLDKRLCDIYLPHVAHTIWFTKTNLKGNKF